MGTIRVRLDPKHEDVIAALIQPNGPYGYRNTSEVVRLAIERLGHEQSDKVSRKDRDALLLEIAQGIRQLIQLVEGLNNATKSLELDRTGNEEIRK